MGVDPALHHEVMRHLDRVLSSPGFVRNERMSAFLRLLVERHLAGRDDELKESLIGVEVFGRRPDFDPKLDSIVRTEAARLRARLMEYYATDGQADAVRIEVPKGRYVPALVVAQPGASGRPPLRGGPAPKSVGVAVGLAVAALVLVVAAGVWWTRRADEAPIPIAVLPLANLSNDAADAYFADGLTDEIIRNLSAVDGLAVRSRTSAFVFRPEPRDVHEVGRQLRVDYLLEGSVLRQGPKLRVNARLIRVRDDQAIWSARFDDRQIDDVFVIQDEIARGIVNQLRVNLGRGTWRYDTTTAAYDLYLRAKAASSEGFVRMVEATPLLERAVALAPSFAPAYASLGRNLGLASVQFAVPHPTGELEHMATIAERGVTLDPLLADAHAAQGLVRARQADWQGAEQSFERAIRLDASASQIRSDFAMWVLYVTNRPAEALAQLEAALESDPLSPYVHMATFSVLFTLGRTDEAAAHCEAPPVPWLRNQCLGRILLAKGQIDEAVERFADDVEANSNPQARGFLGYALARAGRTDDARTMLDAAIEPNEEVLIAAGLGDRNRAIAALEHMAAVGAQRIAHYLNFPELADLRADPRVQALKARVKLPG